MAHPMFWGTSEERSRSNRARLVAWIDQAITIASGLQQPDHPHSEAHAVLCEKARRVEHACLRSTMEEIAGAFGFRLSEDPGP